MVVVKLSQVMMLILAFNLFFFLRENETAP